MESQITVRVPEEMAERLDGAAARRQVRRSQLVREAIGVYLKGARTMTAEELERVSIPGKQVELIRGTLEVREPPGTRHGAVAANLAFELSAFVRERRQGQVFAQDTGFKIGSEPDTVRGPDVAFVSGERLDRIPDEGYAEVAPDLVVEVLSTGDRPGEVLAKIADWLAAGTRLVWLVDPRRREAQVFRPDGSVTVIGDGGSLTGEDVLPGFSCELATVLYTSRSAKQR